MDAMRRASAKDFGPGGIGCRCCRKGDKKYAQDHAHRVARRALKAELRNEAWDESDPTLLINILKDE